MAAKDRIKEEIGWLKVAFVIFAAIDISLIGWLAQNFNSATSNIAVITIIAILTVTFVLIWLNKAAIRRFIQLEREP